MTYNNNGIGIFLCNKKEINKVKNYCNNNSWSCFITAGQLTKGDKGDRFMTQFLRIL